MRTKNTRLGILATAGAGAAALAVAGFAIPANAAMNGGDQTSSWTQSTTATDTQTSLSAFQDAVRTRLQDLSAANGSGNDNASGNWTGNGNTTDTTLIQGPLVSDVANGPILSGNTTPVASGNNVTAPVASGNDTSVTAPVASGNDVANGSGNGNSAASGNNTANGNSAGNGSGNGSANTSAGNGSGNGSANTSVGDIGAQVDNMVGGIGASVDNTVNGVLGGLGR